PPGRHLASRLSLAPAGGEGRRVARSRPCGRCRCAGRRALSAALESWPPTIRPMRDEDLAAVMAIERRAYVYPWSEGIFVDCLRVPYVCEILEESRRVAGYGIMSLGGD